MIFREIFKKILFSFSLLLLLLSSLPIRNKERKRVERLKKTIIKGEKKAIRSGNCQRRNLLLDFILDV